MISPFEESFLGLQNGFVGSLNRLAASVIILLLTQTFCKVAKRKGAAQNHFVRAQNEIVRSRTVL